MTETMLVLGLNGNFSTAAEELVPGMLEFFFHDSSASLARDGELLAAVEEERYNRIKKTTRFPSAAVRACFEETGLGPEDVDAVAFYFPEDHVDKVLGQLYCQSPAVPLRYSRDLVRDRLRSELGWDLPPEKLHYVPHHLAHAMSSFGHSGFESALTVVFDGRGENASGTVYRIGPGGVESLASYPVHQSLGFWYLFGTQLLGYGFGDEYKVMGLAPYGDPARYRSVFESLCSLGEGGGYELLGNVVTPNAFLPAMLDTGFAPRRKGEEFTRDHKDFAAALQETVERIALHVIRHWAERTGERALCFGGGVAHNSSLNGVILRSGLFDRVFVHPASHDAGAGTGAALAVEHRLTGRLPRVALRRADLGGGLGDERDVVLKLKGWDGFVELVHRAADLEDLVDTSARLLADGAVLGWARGRSEFGPRALGSRSIVADPRPAANQTRINAMVKKRESYRPFAPVVTPDAAAEYFEIPDVEAELGFMSFVVPVRPEHRAGLGAVTHVDGTARVQVVTSTANPAFHRLVERFGELTGTPVLLNTSFNNHAEPIVQTFEDVLTSFLTTELDYLVVGDSVVRRRPDFLGALDDAVIRFRPETRVVGRVRFPVGGGRVEEHEVFLDYAEGPRKTISARAHGLLTRVDGKSAVAELVDGEVDDALRQEVLDLWTDRYFTLGPA
ncbi:Nodulation protein nolO [Actinosynnema pretiosum subsp. pretiosum]|nr:Nodulation protein nolO [Actinosynnema pretiosum subsp. pretiosum]